MKQPHSPAIIDIEASGFGPSGYPIEIGVALDDRIKYCTLIRPAPDWTFWDREAEKIHGISRDMLEAHGKPVREVAVQLNAMLAGKTLYSDGWVVDRPWLTTLLHAARMDMAFRVSPLELILSEFQMAHWQPARQRVIEDMAGRRHRASLDAWAIQETYRRTRPGAAGTPLPQG